MSLTSHKQSSNMSNKCRRKLFLHLGTFKSGSKSIQGFLLDNREALHEAKFDSLLRPYEKYFIPYKRKLQVEFHTEAERIPSVRHFTESREYYRERFVEKVTQMLTRSEGDCFLSNENFSDWHPRRFRYKLQMLQDILNGCGADFEVYALCYFRNQASFLESLYFELGLHKRITFMDFIDTFRILGNRDAKNTLSVDWGDWVRLIETEIPQAKILACSFDKAARYGLIAHFCKTVSIADKITGRRERFLNPGYNESGVRILAHITTFSWEDRIMLHNMVSQDSLFRKSQPKEKAFLFTYKQRLEIAEQFHESNKSVLDLTDNEAHQLFFPSTNSSPSVLERPLDECSKKLIQKILKVERAKPRIRMQRIPHKLYQKLPGAVKQYIELLSRYCQGIGIRLYWSIYPHRTIPSILNK